MSSRCPQSDPKKKIDQYAFNSQKAEWKFKKDCAGYSVAHHHIKSSCRSKLLRKSKLLQHKIFQVFLTGYSVKRWPIGKDEIRLTIGKQQGAAYYGCLQGKQSPLSGSNVTIIILSLSWSRVKILHWRRWREGAKERSGKRDKGFFYWPREIKVAQNETSPADCIPVIQLWWWWWYVQYNVIHIVYGFD